MNRIYCTHKSQVESRHRQQQAETDDGGKQTRQGQIEVILGPFFLFYFTSLSFFFSRICACVHQRVVDSLTHSDFAVWQVLVCRVVCRCFTLSFIKENQPKKNCQGEEASSNVCLYREFGYFECCSSLSSLCCLLLCIHSSYDDDADDLNMMKVEILLLLLHRSRSRKLEKY